MSRPGGLERFSRRLRSFGRFVSQLVVSVGLPLVLLALLGAGFCRRPAYVTVELVTRAATLDLSPGYGPVELRELVDSRLRLRRVEWSDVSAPCDGAACAESWVPGRFRASASAPFALPLRVLPIGRLRVERTRDDRASLVLQAPFDGEPLTLPLLRAALPFAPGTEVEASGFGLPPGWDTPAGASDELVPATIELEARGASTTVGLTVARPDGSAPTLLDVPLDVRAVSLSEQLAPGRIERWIEQGVIRFPDGEKKDIELRPQSLLRVGAEDPLLLKKAALGPQGLELGFEGVATELRAGAAQPRNELPTYLEWILSRGEWQWLGGLLGAIVAAAIGVSWSEPSAAEN